MAGNGTDRRCGMARGLPEADKTRRRILAISSEQRSLDALGLACSSLRADPFANLSCGNKYSRRAKERSQRDQHTFRLMLPRKLSVLLLQDREENLTREGFLKPTDAVTEKRLETAPCRGSMQYREF